MIEEQNAAGSGSEAGETTGKESANTDNASTGQTVDGTDNVTVQDDYYAVDHGKKEVISTIGDGEMHDEGLAGAGDVSADILTSQDVTDEQDIAEAHDSEA